MATNEITKLRYCYEVLRRRIESQDEDLSYWQMNLKIVAYFLKRYDPGFPSEGYPSDEHFLKIDEEDILRTHHLLQHPNHNRQSFPNLTPELELEFKQRIALYFKSRTK